MLINRILIGIICFTALINACSNHFLVEENRKTTLKENPFYLNPENEEFIKNPSLREKLGKNAYQFFRFINIPFSREVCQDFRPALEQMPLTNLHGDAHLEQYAITDSGRGLTDFDDASTGPPLLDWMRFAVSLQLACQMMNQPEAADSLIQIFLSGYAKALQDFNEEAPEPGLIKRIRGEFSYEPAAYFSWIHQLMKPIRKTEQDSLLEAMKPYFKYQYQMNPKLVPTYFNVKQTGSLQMGVGSALDQKYLLQLQGPSPDQADDVILEVKEVRNLSGIDCIQRQPVMNPLRIILAESRIAYQPFEFLGCFQFKNKYFWVHAWGRHYKELKVPDSFQAFSDLAEVVFDAGMQLGKGHVKYIAAPHDELLRQEILKTLSQNQENIKIAARKYAKMINAAWNAFQDNKK